MPDPYAQFSPSFAQPEEDPYAQFSPSFSGAAPPGGIPSPSPAPPGGAAPPMPSPTPEPGMPSVPAPGLAPEQSIGGGLLEAGKGAVDVFNRAMSIPDRLIGETIERAGSQHLPESGYPSFTGDVFLNPDGSRLSTWLGKRASEDISEKLGPLFSERADTPEERAALEKLEKQIAAVTEGGTEILAGMLTDPSMAAGAASRVTQIGKLVRAADTVLAAGTAARFAPDAFAGATENLGKIKAGDTSPETLKGLVQSMAGLGVTVAAAAGAGGDIHARLRGGGTPHMEVSGEMRRLEEPAPAPQEVVTPAVEVPIRGAETQTLPESGFSVSRNPKTGTVGLKGPDGEKVGLRVTADRIEMISIGKGTADTSRSAQQAIREFAQAEGKPVYSTSTNLSQTGGEFRQRMMDRGDLAETPEGLLWTGTDKGAAPSKPELELLGEKERLTEEAKPGMQLTAKQPSEGLLTQMDEAPAPENLSAGQRRDLMRAVLEPQLRAAHRLERKLEPMREVWSAETAKRQGEAEQMLSGEARNIARRDAAAGKFLTPEGKTLEEVRVREDFKEPAQWIKDLVHDEAYAAAPQIKRTLDYAVPKLLENKYLQRNEIDALREGLGLSLRDVDPKSGIINTHSLGTMARLLIEARRFFKLGMDDSAVLNQGFVFAMNAPFNKAQRRVFKDAFVKHLLSVKEANYERLNKEMVASPEYDLAARSGVDFTDMPGGRYKPDDIFINAADIDRVLGKAGKIPILGIVPRAVREGYRASQRMYNTYLNRLRVGEFHRMRELLGIDLKAAVDGKISPEQLDGLRAAASAANVLTGRGDTRMGLLGNLGHTRKGATSAGYRQQAVLKTVMRPLAYIFTSPSMQLARLQSVDPTYYRKLKNLSPEVAREARNQVVRAYSTAASLVAVAAATGLAETSYDPNSADFMKLRVGKTRYDLGGGYTQMMRAMYQTFSGKKVDLAGRERSISRLEPGGNYIYNKVHPGVRPFLEFAAGKMAPGDKTVAGWAMDSLDPAFFDDVWDQLKTDPRVIPLLMTITSSAFGRGVTVYDEPAQYSERERRALEEGNRLGAENRTLQREKRSKERRERKPGVAEPVDVLRRLRDAQRRNRKLREETGR